MIKSMTGFGQVVLNSGTLAISVEVKSLNSKFLDLNLRLPRKFSEKELELRTLVADKLERGKISLGIDYQQSAKLENSSRYNEELFVSYYTELKRLADKVMSGYDNLFQMALNSPDVMISTGKEELDPTEWERVKLLINEALEKCEQFRLAEGKSLEKKLAEYIENIRKGLSAVEQLDPKRLEQEIIFYIEKLDIHEERVRLKTHLDYFLKGVSDKQSNGKKLAFIAQEIGREVNTIGSKANDAEMQQHVVMMKEELEKIKEQLNNIL
jgi:uncharacterized protein YicC (UPF0701 family)